MSNFNDLHILPQIIQSLEEQGYEIPTPVQEASIPFILEGRDLLGQAHTGTGKTAAFALPILTMIDLSLMQPQAIILTPTRELAIQVAESFQRYAKYLKGFHVLPIYGGQDYRPQLRALERGVHVIVGTPGRVMDHLRRGSLSMKVLKVLVLDEADEMLNMGFLEDVKWILQQLPAKHQTALFSATLPDSIKKIADEHLKNPHYVQLISKQSTVNSIEQFYMIVSRHHKLEALTRFLDTEDVDGMLIFTRTKIESAEVAEKLAARGFAAAAINGDMKQDARERVIKQIKNRTLDIVVATEIAARGLDVDRLSHVVNYDIPYDAESYVHRIGRTGRAGRLGKALLFVEPREVRMLKEIERRIKQPLISMKPASLAQLSQKLFDNVKKQVLSIIESKEGATYRLFIEELMHAHEISAVDVAMAMSHLLLKDKQKLFNHDKPDVFLHAFDENADRSSFRERSGGSGERRRSPSKGGYKKTDRPKPFGGSSSGAKEERKSSPSTFKKKKPSSGSFQDKGSKAPYAGVKSSPKKPK